MPKKMAIPKPRASGGSGFPEASNFTMIVGSGTLSSATDRSPVGSNFIARFAIVTA